MNKTSEGVLISSLQKEIGQLQDGLGELHPLPKLARQQFIYDIKKAIGSTEDPLLPMGLRSTLDHLLDACTDYFEQGKEDAFVALCEQAIERCGQGWSHLSYWVCSEQNLCYAIFWSLRVALEKHQKQISMYSGSQNDCAPKTQLLRMPTLEAK